MARDLTVTDWLTGNPVHIGWYDVRWTSGSIQRRWWDGAKWLCSPDGDKSFCGESYGDTFRGLTAPHAGVAEAQFMRAWARPRRQARP